MAADIDGDTATLAFTLEVVRTQVQVTVIDATAQESRPVEFEVALSWAAVGPVTLHWTAGQPGSATLDEDYEPVSAGRMRLATDTTTGTLPVPTLDDRWVELTETFTVTITLPADALIESAKAAQRGRSRTTARPGRASEVWVRSWGGRWRRTR